VREARFWGGADNLNIAADTTIDPRRARCWRIAVSAPALKLKMLDARLLRRGTPCLVIHHASGNAITLADSTGATLATLSPLDVAVVGLADNSTAAGVWTVRKSVIALSTPAMLRTKPTVVGGTATTTTTTQYDDLANSWATLGAAPHGKVEGAAFAIGPVGFFVGLDPATPGTSEQLAELRLGAWTTRTQCPFGPARTCGASVRGKGYVFSGVAAANVAEYAFDAWTAKAAIPYTKTRATAQGINHRAFIFSGEPVPTPNLCYDPLLDSYWSIAYQPSATRHSMSSFAIGARAYVVGGYLDSPLTRYDNCDEYDPLTDTWVARTPIASGVRYRGAGCGGNGKGYYFAGRDVVDAAGAGAQSYNLDAWTTLATMPAARAEIQNQGVPL
jgi:hypothetical protein